ncbi:hypothetical protein [Actinophytocola glycyrrhizae]|uniref:Uncharacterized protein n=1 Tax=Actinophytocola glycyrrhizae TaxID=2044873 RepID=A0ABV9S6C3_9PSEU
MAGRSAWLWPLAVAVTVSVTGIAVNIATELKTSGLAWASVVVATVAGGVVTFGAQSATSGTRVFRPAVALGVVGCVAAVVLGTFAVAGAADTAAEQGAAGPERVVQDTASYELVSSDGFCPTGDKVDLDTAQSGHGGQTQLGDYLGECRVEGGLAELILEQDEVHGPGNAPLFSVPRAGAAIGYDECRAAVDASERLRSRLFLDELRNGDTFCAVTDEGRVARISVLDVSVASKARLTIAFVTWG